MESGMLIAGVLVVLCIVILLIIFRPQNKSNYKRNITSTRNSHDWRNYD